MFSKNVAIRCPYCGAGFSIPVGAKYISTEAIAIDKSRNLPGQNTICPNPRCYRDIFIHYTVVWQIHESNSTQNV